MNNIHFSALFQTNIIYFNAFFQTNVSNSILFERFSLTRVTVSLPVNTLDEQFKGAMDDTPTSSRD